MYSRKNIIVINLLIVYFFKINLMKCDPFFDHLDKVSTQTVNENDEKERNSILKQFNLTQEQLDRAKHNMLHNLTSARASAPLSAGQNYSKKGFRHEQVIDQIKDLRNINLTSSITTTKIYPICTQQNNEQVWHNEFNQTIRFGDSSINLNMDENPIDTVSLYMYKIPVKDNFEHGITMCNKTVFYRQIRVTISVYLQLDSRKRKKIMCSTTMVPYVQQGWIEMDIKRAIYTWMTANNTNNNFKLFLEAHDEENVPLKPGDFFMPIRCLHRSSDKIYNSFQPLKKEEDEEQYLYIKIEHNKDCSSVT
ncbi:hypothetical protein ACFFRR_003487 [Megaselia abdita]